MLYEMKSADKSATHHLLVVPLAYFHEEIHPFHSVLRLLRQFCCQMANALLQLKPQSTVQALAFIGDTDNRATCGIDSFISSWQGLGRVSGKHCPDGSSDQRVIRIICFLRQLH
jgi:hypothetical protein